MANVATKLNRSWHDAHRMPVRATLEQRVDWHSAHQQHCACRPAPASIAKEIARLATKR